MAKISHFLMYYYEIEQVAASEEKSKFRSNNYGEVKVVDTVQFPALHVGINSGYSGQIWPVDVYNTTEFKLFDHLVLQEGEYIIHCVTPPNPRKIVQRNCCEINMNYTRSSPDAKYGIGNYQTCDKEQYRCVGKYWIDYYTNLANKYRLRQVENDQENQTKSRIAYAQKLPLPRPYHEIYIETPIKTNIKLNKIFIDILKACNFCDGAFAEISKILQTSNDLDDVDTKLKNDLLTIELQRTKQQLHSTTLESNARATEIAELKQQLQIISSDSEEHQHNMIELRRENEELKKQIAEVAIFKQCLARMVNDGDVKHRNDPLVPTKLGDGATNNLNTESNNALSSTQIGYAIGASNVSTCSGEPLKESPNETIGIINGVADIKNYWFANSVIDECYVNDVALKKLKYQSILINVYKIINNAQTIIKNTCISVVQKEKHDDGFNYVKDIGISFAGVPATKCLQEIITQCVINKIKLKMVIRLDMNRSGNQPVFRENKVNVVKVDI